MTPRRSGLALAITVGLLYSRGALIWALAPGPFLGSMNNLFQRMACRRPAAINVHLVKTIAAGGRSDDGIYGYHTHASSNPGEIHEGLYARIRHPQYVAFVLILLGSVLQWPTLLTLVMFPILLVMYGRLALNEEAEMRAQFGEEFDRYAQRTPRFFPAWGKAQPLADAASRR